MVAVLLLVAGCAQTVTGTASPAPGGGGPGSSATPLPLDPDEQALAAVFETARSWDMCAVHDVQAAAQITGYTPDELMPYLGLDSCRLYLKQPDGPSQWEVRVRIAPVTPLEGGPPPLTLGAAQVPQTGYASESSCSYTYPIGPAGSDLQWGIELTAGNVSANRPPCDVARDYLNAVGQRLVSPPLRTEGRTNPALALGGTDPCAVASALVPVLANGAPVDFANSRADLSGPYECNVAVRVDQGTAPRDVRASVAISVDNTPLEGATVAGRPATHQSLGSDCDLTYQAGDVLVPGNPGFDPTYETVEITTSCEEVQRVTEEAAAVLGTPVPAATPIPEAQVLGDLDVPPSAAQAGAPFDPCTVVGWDAYPAELRPTGPKTPTPMDVGPDSGFSVGCSYNVGPMFSSIVWGLPAGGFTADPVARGEGATPAQFSGKAGTEQRSTYDAQGQINQVCFGAVQLANGIAAMSTMLPTGDPCAVNRPILERIAASVP